MVCNQIDNSVVKNTIWPTLLKICIVALIAGIITGCDASLPSVTFKDGSHSVKKLFINCGSLKMRIMGFQGRFMGAGEILDLSINLNSGAKVDSICLYPSRIKVIVGSNELATTNTEYILNKTLEFHGRSYGSDFYICPTQNNEYKLNFSYRCADSLFHEDGKILKIVLKEFLSDMDLTENRDTVYVKIP